MLTRSIPCRETLIGGSQSLSGSSQSDDAFGVQRCCLNQMRLVDSIAGLSAS